MIQSETISEQQLLNYLLDGMTIVTGNLRLGRALSQLFNQHAIASGKEVWSTPEILPWDVWLKGLWEQLMLSHAIEIPAVVLSNEQELIVWEQIIEASEYNRGLMRLAETAWQVQSAYGLLQAWKIPVESENFDQTIDTQAFQQWFDTFNHRCKENNWLSQEAITAQIISACRTGTKTSLTSSKLILTGFDELSPQQQELLNSLKSEVQWVEFEHINSFSARMACSDIRQEIKTMSRWVRQCYQKNPMAKIGIVVPDLGSSRGVIINELDKVLVPDTLQPGCGDGYKPYNLTLGLPLIEYPIIRAAFKLLECVNNAIPIETSGIILRSPFINGWNQEASARALLDRRLRSERELTIDLKTIKFYASMGNQPWYCPVLLEHLRAITKKIAAFPATAAVDQWLVLIADILTVSGWSQGCKLNSKDYQTVEAWKQLFSSCASLGDIMGNIDLKTTVSLLKRVASARIFQPQTEQTTIQVLGLYEATGLQFDHLWVMGLDDAAWPPKAHPNPFLPLSLQRNLNIPHSSANRELEHARKLTERLLGSGKEVVISHSLQGSQGEELASSPLLEAINPVDIEDLDLGSEKSWFELIMQQNHRCDLGNDKAPAVTGEEVKGGSALFKYQAACPFRAFAEFRLGAKAFDQAEEGLDAMKRGSLIHEIMELTWSQIKTHENLLKLQQTDEFNGILEAGIKTGLARLTEQHPGTMTTRFTLIEAKRIKQLLQDWFAIEAQRAPFEVIGFEKKYMADIEGIKVNLQVDRIDQLTNENNNSATTESVVPAKVLIDYKTGEVKPSHWFGERPEEPQLPLYSYIVAGDKSAILFAQVKAGKSAYKGIVAQESLIPGLPPSHGDPNIKNSVENWDAIQEDWARVLKNLARDYQQGKADVDPKVPASTCTYCDLGTLCRINEKNMLSVKTSSHNKQQKSSQKT